MGSSITAVRLGNRADSNMESVRAEFSLMTFVVWMSATCEVPSGREREDRKDSFWR